MPATLDRYPVFRKPAGKLSAMTLQRALDKCGQWTGEPKRISLGAYWTKHPPISKRQADGHYYLTDSTGTEVEVGALMFCYAIAPEG
jgi:hypothetical protein